MNSASGLQHIAACPGSAALARAGHVTRAADKGTAGHEHMRMRAELGVDDAVAQLDELFARYDLDEQDAHWLKRRLMRFEWSPPVGAVCETSLCLMHDGSVRRVEGGQGSYPDLPAGAVLPGQIDLMWAEPAPLVWDMGEERPACPENSVLWVADYKFGQDRYVHTVERNLQTTAYTVMAAKWTGAKLAVPAIIYPGPGDGEWDTLAAPWGEKQLAEADLRVASVLAEVEVQKLAAAEGRALRLVEGRHCEFCEAQSWCPAKTALLKTVVSGEAAPLGEAPLTEAEAAYWVTQLRLLNGIAPRVTAALKAYVEATGPIDLGDGVVWGPVEERKSIIVAEQAREVLEDELGEHARSAMQVKVTKTAIDDAIRVKHAEEGIKKQKAATMRRIMARLGEEGALVHEPRVEWKAHRPKKAEPEQQLEEAS